MPPIIGSEGAASSKGYGLFSQQTEVPYIEDVFSTYLYTGNGSTQTITNNIDLSGEGGLVWIKNRSTPTNTGDHRLYDTLRGANNALFSNTTDASTTLTSSLTSFNSTGFSLGTNAKVNESAVTWASWTFRKAPKFFDVVTYTGTGSARTIAHNLGSAPGFIIVKRTNSADEWFCYHRSLSANNVIYLNLTNATNSAPNMWNNTAPTSTVFSLGTDTGVNANGGTYVAYLFAHNAGGFGLTGTDNVISCGTYTGNSGLQSINLGFEAQFVLVKYSSGAGTNWILYDSTRGLADSDQNQPELVPNSTIQENLGVKIYATATGFGINDANIRVNASGQQYIYVAIRRGPMKVPTSGTTVFAPITRTGDGTGGDPSLVVTNTFTDAAMVAWRSGTAMKFNTVTRLTNNRFVITANGNAQSTGLPKFPTLTFPANNGFFVGNDSDSSYYTNGSGGDYINYAFGRAPNFFDVVVYKGTSSSSTQFNHNLGVTPELVIVKNRSSSTTNWPVKCTHAAAGYQSFFLNTGDGGADYGGGYIQTLTSTYFTVASDIISNANPDLYTALLFATCPGVSKVGVYTGAGVGTTKQINCGFTGGARLVVIKRVDSTGDWYVWDSARGIVAGNDPYLRFNSVAAEITSTDYIDTYSAGFEISSTAPAAINNLGSTYIFLAIA